MKRPPSVCVPFLPLPRLTPVPWNCFGLRRGLRFLRRQDSGLVLGPGSGLGSRDQERRTGFGAAPRQHLVGGREAIRRDTEVRDELHKKLAPFGGDGTAGGGPLGQRQVGREPCPYLGRWPFNLCPSVGCISLPTSQESGSAHRTPNAKPPLWPGFLPGPPTWSSWVRTPPQQPRPSPPPGSAVVVTRGPQVLPPSPWGCVTAELPQPLGVVVHGSIKHADRIVAAVGVRLQVKLPEGQRDHLVGGGARLRGGPPGGPRAQKLCTVHHLRPAASLPDARGSPPPMHSHHCSEDHTHVGTLQWRPSQSSTRLSPGSFSRNSPESTSTTTTYKT